MYVWCAKYSDGIFLSTPDNHVCVVHHGFRRRQHRSLGRSAVQQQQQLSDVHSYKEKGGLEVLDLQLAASGVSSHNKINAVRRREGW